MLFYSQERTSTTHPVRRSQLWRVAPCGVTTPSGTASLNFFIIKYLDYVCCLHELIPPLLQLHVPTTPPKPSHLPLLGVKVSSDGGHPWQGMTSTTAINRISRVNRATQQPPLLVEMCLPQRSLPVEPIIPWQGYDQPHTITTKRAKHVLWGGHTLRRVWAPPPPTPEREPESEPPGQTGPQGRKGQNGNWKTLKH